MDACLERSRSHQHSGRPDSHCFHTDLSSLPPDFCAAAAAHDVCCPGSFQWAPRQTGWKHSQCNVMHSLKGTCEQNSLTAHWSETWPNKSSSLHISNKGDQNKHTSWDKFRFQTKKHHRLTTVVMSHGLWTEPGLDKWPVSHYLTVLMIIWRRTKKRSIANKKKGNEDHSTLSTVLSCRYQRGISSSKNPDLHFIVA